MADIKRADNPADPNRCQCVNTQGQCNNKAVEGGTFCLAHGGNKQLEAKEQAELRNYRKSKWLGRISEHADSSGIKSLREEIGILRVLMEERLDACDTSLKLILQSQSIADLVMKIEHVVTSCHKLEDKLKAVVDRSQLLQFASMTIDIIASVISDEQMLTVISDKILAAIGKLGEENV